MNGHMQASTAAEQWENLRILVSKVERLTCIWFDWLSVCEEM